MCIRDRCRLVRAAHGPRAPGRPQARGAYEAVGRIGQRRGKTSQDRLFQHSACNALDRFV
eukprot:4332234-Alexandrium_andersonii.AAC.1